MGEARICVGVIAGAHGVRGLVKIKSFTEPADNLAAYGTLIDEGASRRFEITLIGQSKGALLGRIAGVTDRDQAQALRGQRLFIERHALPPLGGEEFYHADLIGLAVEDRTGRPLGRIKAVQNYGGGDVLEIADAEGREILLPFTRAVVPQVDIAGGRVVAEPPAEGPGGEAEGRKS